MQICLILVLKRVRSASYLGWRVVTVAGLAVGGRRGPLARARRRSLFRDAIRAEDSAGWGV